MWTRVNECGLISAEYLEFWGFVQTDTDAAGQENGAGEGNRTPVFSLGSCCSTIELHPRPTRRLHYRGGLVKRGALLDFFRLSPYATSLERNKCSTPELARH